MTTTLHRISITETPPVASAIDIAMVTWPELQNNRAAALRRIIEIGSAAIQRDREERVARRLAAIDAGAGSATGVYPPDAIKTLREEWPE